MKFNKRPTTVNEQIEILKERGVTIDNSNAAEILLRVNYYRFCGYGLSFELYGENGTRLDKFQEGTTFNQIYRLLLWDEQLRSLLQRNLGYLEILFRSVLNYSLVTDTQNPFWFLDKSIMKPSFNLGDIQTECKDAFKRAIDNNELSAIHFRNTYVESEYPPCWILAELFSFGKWSKLFGFLKMKNHIKSVAGKLKAPPNDVAPWIHSLVILRNRCAHHCRLWDYHYSKTRPSLTPAMKRKGFSNDSLGALIYILHDLLSTQKDVQQAFARDFNTLITQCPGDYTTAIGLQKGFQL